MCKLAKSKRQGIPVLLLTHHLIDFVIMEQLVQTTPHLELVKAQLKSEFIGLEEIIDQFIDAVTPWCTMGESQARPLVVNLWGMTGVGKTTLVKRFLELWNPDEQVVNFNMGSRSYFRDLLGSLENMTSLDGKPCVFIFDEFQHAKTMENSFKEAENPLDRMIWQLLDDGKFLYTRSFYDMHDFQELIFSLELSLERGVKVEKGKVIEGWQIFKDLNPDHDHVQKRFGDTGGRNFLTERNISMVYELIQPEFKFKSMLRDYLFQLDGKEILNFLKRLEKKYSVARTLDFSKALIFVIGNLDEAFDMSGEVSADDDPDIFHEASKKITFSRIKEGLKERFRMEEISRLGNIHLIYPAFSRAFFNQFISKELEEIGQRFHTAFGCTLRFSNEIHQMLFEEGVTASQGFRPLRSSIRYLVESTLANLFQNLTFDQGEEALIGMKGDDLVIIQYDLELGRKRLHLAVREAKRKKLAPQTKAITAVHEIGHALVYSVVFGRLPKMVTLSSSDYFSGGYVQGESMLDFDSYEIVLRDAAVKMAGKKAEELVFGKNHQITFGCVSDLKSATRSLLNMVRSGVLPDMDQVFESAIHGTGNLLPESTEEITWVKAQLEKASQMAAQILEEHQDVFRKMIQILLTKRSLDQLGMEEALKEEGVNVQHLLSIYPPLTDYSLKLETFLNQA